MREGNKSDNLYLHVDGDSFFVACEVSKRPELKGKPVVVGADRGIAVAMSMEAKALGVTRGMPVFQIKKLLPQVVILPHNFKLYRKISDRLYEILSDYFEEVEVYSIDECFALVQPFEIVFYGSEEKLMKSLKRDIAEKLNVSYSIGLARTKALSKLASKLEKPNGSVMLLIKADETRALKATSIDDIWGIGRQTIPRLQRLGMKTAYDFTNYPQEFLERDFSTPVQVLQKEFLGEQIMTVDSDTDPRDQKSIQSTATFRPTSSDPKVIRRELSENAEHACSEARELNLVSNKVLFFVKTTEFKYRFAEIKLDDYISDPGIIMDAIESKLTKILSRKERIRSTGIILHNLTREEKVPRDLFGSREKAQKVLAIEEAADAIRKKFGRNAILRGSSLSEKPLNSNTGNSFEKRKK